MKNSQTLRKQARTLVRLSVNEHEVVDDKKASIVVDRLLADNQLDLLRAYKDALSQKLAEHTVTIESAQPVGQSMAEQILAAVEKQTGKKFIVKTVENPDLVAGIKLWIYDTVYDYSVQGSFIQLKETLQA